MREDIFDSSTWAEPLLATELCENALVNTYLTSANRMVAECSVPELVELPSTIHGTLCVDEKLNWPEHNTEPFLRPNSTYTDSLKMVKRTWQTENPRCCLALPLRDSGLRFPFVVEGLANLDFAATANDFLYGLVLGAVGSGLSALCCGFWQSGRIQKCPALDEWGMGWVGTGGHGAFLRDKQMSKSLHPFS